MRKLVLTRKYLPLETLGLYIVFNDYTEFYRCMCIELPWLNNQHNISCIPEDVYDVEKFNIAPHLNTFHILNVPNRDGILIHPGNFATGKQIDTLGCQMPGLEFIDIDGNGMLDVAGSTQAMAALNYFLPDKFKIHII
jgi:hypothetical protein